MLWKTFLTVQHLQGSGNPLARQQDAGHRAHRHISRLQALPVREVLRSCNHESLCRRTDDRKRMRGPFPWQLERPGRASRHPIRQLHGVIESALLYGCVMNEPAEDLVRHSK